MTGRKVINQYEVIEELGRGQHGKVKLARNLETGENVAIKIIPRLSKSRRLGKVSAIDPRQNTKREIAILKKIRHPHVVALLEVIDDPELRKIYMVLEHVERGEIVWRKKGLPHICKHERQRIERGMRGEPTYEDDEWQLPAAAVSPAARRPEAGRELGDKLSARSRSGLSDSWNMETIGAGDGASDPWQGPRLAGSRPASRTPSQTRSARSASRATTPHPSEPGDASSLPGGDDDGFETPGPLRSNHASSTALDGTMYGAYVDDPMLRGRSPSMADSVMSQLSSIDFSAQAHDPFADDYSYVPCFTLEQARKVFRETVLGLEYLHYQGVVHRDIKPANLLWTKDYQVKISDFGVSYFGRPIRDGEPDDAISESEAQDFDDDRELSKTVGTPAFFAPELCYTDLEREPPKVSEQIDVWSLGVTLYCLIFARIPFLAEDEFTMFRKIATEDVYIPRRRLRPVAPDTDPTKVSLYKRVNHEPYRNDDDLVYEDVDDSIIDLLRQMLVKNPEKRIRLRDVKRHRFVAEGIPNLLGWIDDTDPSRRTAGRKIQVDDKEIGRAVVPLTFLERAKSAVKKTIEKVIHPRADRAESTSRRSRAASSAASSAGDSPSNPPGTPYSRDSSGRRKSIRGDDYFATVTQMPINSHPLTHSVTASPDNSPHDGTTPAAEALKRSGEVTAPEGHAPQHHGFLDFARPPPQHRHGHGHVRSFTNAFVNMTHGLHEPRTVPATPSAHLPREDFAAAFRQTRDIRSAVDDQTRSRSVDRATFVFPNADKRAEAVVGLNVAPAPATVRGLSSTRHPRPMRSIDLGRTTTASSPLPSPHFFSPRAVSAYQHGQPKSDTNIHEKQRAILELEERPATAHRMPDASEPGSSPYRNFNSSTPDSFARARESHVFGLRRSDREDRERGPAGSAYLPSPDDELSAAPVPSRENSGLTNLTSSSASLGEMGQTPLTSPSDLANTSFIACGGPGKGSGDAMLAFQSDPSLPALLSGASSVSADAEGEFLGNPGEVGTTSVIETSDSLTPPALDKETIATGFPVEQQQELKDQQDWNGQSVISVDIGAATAAASAAPDTVDDDDDDSDSDDGLLMAKSTKKRVLSAATSAKRRDTNTSIASNETAKKVGVEND